MTIRKTLGALLVGLTLVAVMPSVTEAAHRHSRGCGHTVRSRSYSSYSYRPSYSYYGSSYYDRSRYYDDVDYDAPYVARHGSGRSRYYDDEDRYGYYDYRDYGYRDYGYRGYSRSSYSPRYYGSRRAVGYHYHGRTRCYSSHRPHVHFSIHLGF